MIRFGHFYIGRRFVVYDVCMELVDGRPSYVASQSDNPRIAFRAEDPADAVAQLERYLRQLSSFAASRVA